jgi:hypothetical protein
MIFNFNTIILRNSADEITFADFSCKYRGGERPTDTKVREYISDAVNVWRRETEEGDRAWEYSAEDFNIGDLSCHLDDPILLNEMNKRGVFDINIDIYSFDAYQPTPWSYDDILGK